MNLKYEFYIGEAPERVWKALVSPEDTKKIYYGSVIESTFEVGSSLKYVGPGEGGAETVHVYGEVLAFEPHETFSFTHHPGPAYVEEHEKYGSRITYTLEPVGNCTKLTLVHDAWIEDDPTHASSVSSWPAILSNTKTLIETGETLEME